MSSKKILSVVLVALLGTLCAGCGNKEKESASSNGATKKGSSESSSDDSSDLHGVDGNCAAPPDWFKGKIPTPKPEDFPQGDDVTNCDFHLLSWQYFLWLTEEVDGKARFESLYTDRAIHPDSKDDKNHVLDIVEQALSKGVLVDQNGRAVYSNIMINSVYRDWVLNNKLYDPAEFRKFPADNDFPVGSLSLKACWKIVAEGDDTSKLYTTKMSVQKLTMVDGVPRIPENPEVEKDVEVALVALHIAIVPKGHPEFVWATFEYDNNAPNFATEQKMNEPVSDKSWLFYKQGTTALNCNANNASTLAFADEKLQTLTPITQVARQYINGGGSKTNQENIEHLNQNIKSQLEGSVWANYFEVGAVWFNTSKGTLKPNWSPNVDDSMVTGSLKLSNSTIETFTQKVGSMNQCFSCHNTMSVTSLPEGIETLAGKNANTSHVLLKNYQKGGEVQRRP